MASLEDRWYRKDGTPKARCEVGDRWRILWRDAAGDQRAQSFPRKADAMRFKHDVESKLDRNQYHDPTRGKVTFDEVARWWWAAHSPLLATATQEHYRGMLDGRVLQRWGRLPVQAIEYSDLAAWTAELSAEGLSGSRVRHHLVVVSQVLDHAVRDGRLPANPARLVRKPRPAPARRHRYLTGEQLDELADASQECRPMILVLGYCGVRWGECIALRPEDVDFVKGRLHVERSMDAKGRFHHPKDHERREVPVSDYVLEVLEREMPADGLLFRSPTGSWIHHSNWVKRTWTPSLGAVGLPHMRIHELRHTAASLAVSSGADVLAVSRMLGHSDPSITLKVYADLFDHDLDDVRARMDTLARKARETRRSRGDVIDLRDYREGTTGV